MESAAPPSARWLLLPAVAAAFVLGVWVAGGVLTNSFKASMALVAVWYAGAGAAVLVAGLRRRALRGPLWTGYAVTAAAVGIFLAWTTLRDRVVHERVLVGVPATQVARAPDAAVPAVVTVRRGHFVSGEHETRGLASVVQRRDGTRYLTLTGFDTSPGPDLRVRVGPGDNDLGALKGNRGDQQYRLPRGTDVATVTIWCRAFSASFGSARLKPA
jgi:Electron transfer DM13